MGDEVNQIFSNLFSEKDIFKKAQFLRTLKKEKDIPVKDIAKRLNIKPSYVSHILRLNKLPPLVIDGYYNKSLTPTHLYILARLHKQEEMIMAYEHVLANNLSVLDTEILVRSVLYGIKHEGEYISKAEIQEFSDLMKQFDLEVKIVQSRIRAKCTIEIKGSLLTSTVKLREVMQLLRRYTKEGTKPDFL